MFTEHAITLNIVPGDVPPVAHVSQYDVGREIRITLLDGSKGFELSPDYSYTLVGTKSSGTGFSYDDIFEISNNALVFKTNGQMTVADGPVVCGIIIMDGDEHVETLSFILEVHQSALTTDTIVDSDDFHSIIQDEVRAYLDLSGILIDRYLRTRGAAADAKATGDAIKAKISKPTTNPNGNNGQYLKTNGDGTTTWVDAPIPSAEAFDEQIQEWLDNHPEATLNVEDGSVTFAKLSDGVNALLDEVNELDENYASIDFENVNTQNVSAGFARRLLTDQGLIDSQQNAITKQRTGYLTTVNVVGDSIQGGTLDGDVVNITNVPASHISGQIVGSQIAPGAVGAAILATGVTDQIDSALAIAGLARTEISSLTENVSDFESSVTSSIADLQDQIDGAIETWFYSGVPSTSTEPEVNWTTTDEKNNHLGDLYYDSETGYCYRYQLNDGSYEWHLIADSDISEALRIANQAQDTADGKRRVFYNAPSDLPNPPYDLGDLWVQGNNGDIMRCATAKVAGEIKSSSDWILASKYTDNTYAQSVAQSLTDFITGDYADDLAAIQGQIDGKAETWYQSSDPSTNWTTAAQRSEHIGDLWYNSTSTVQKYYRWNGSAWAELTATPPDSVLTEIFDEVDGKAQIFTSQPKPPYSIGDLWFNSTSDAIKVCTYGRESGNYVASDWVKRDYYTDDTTAEQAVTIANGKSTAYYQTTAPSGSTHSTNDIWFDTDNDNKMYSWNGTQWVPRQFATDAIAAEAITADQIASRTITAGKIVSGTITANEIAGATITGDNIKGNTITAANIAANTITSDEINTRIISVNNDDDEYGENMLLASDITTYSTNNNQTLVTTDYDAERIITYSKKAVANLGFYCDAYARMTPSERYTVSFDIRLTSGTCTNLCYYIRKNWYSKVTIEVDGTAYDWVSNDGDASKIPLNLVDNLWHRIRVYLLTLDSEHMTGTSNYLGDILQFNKASTDGGPFTMEFRRLRWGKMGGTIIDGDHIITGTIDASRVNVENLNADNINAGTITGIAINNGDGTFSVDPSGNLKATNAQLTGSVRSVDPEIEYWYYTGAPASNKPPESNWTTTELKTEHLGDIYADTTSSTYVWYRYTYKNSAYAWVEIPEEEAIQTIPANSVFSQMHGGALTWYDSKRSPILPLKGYIGFKNSLGSAEQDDYFLHINHAFETDYDFDSGTPGGIKLGYYGGTSDPHMTLTLDHNISHRPFICEDGLTVNGKNMLSDMGSANLVSGTNNNKDTVAAAYAIFEKGGWRSAGGGTGTITKISVGDGTLTLPPNSNIKYGWRITCNTDTSTTDYASAKCIGQDDISAMDGGTYTISCYARLINTADTDAKVHMFIGKSKFGPTDDGKISITSTKWTHISVTHILPSGDVGYVNASGKANAFFGVKNAPHGIDICGMKVEFGNRATDWSPAPFECDNDSLDVGGRNLFINTQYPNVSTAAKYPKLLNSSANTTVSSGTKTVAEHGIRITSTGATRPNIRFGSSTLSSATIQCLKPGKTYTWSFDAKWKLLSGTISNSTTYYVRAYLYTDETGSFAATYYETYGTITQADRGTEMSGRCEFTFTVPAAATKAYLITNGSTYSTTAGFAAGDYLEISNIKLEEGNKATAWSPAPEDAISYIDEEIEERSPRVIYENATPTSSQAAQTLTLLESIVPYNFFTIEIIWSTGYYRYCASTQVYVPDNSSVIAMPSITWYNSGATTITSVNRYVTIDKSDNSISISGGHRYGSGGADGDGYAVVTRIIAQKI